MDDDDLWADYTRLSQQADSSTLCDKTWAVDDALNAILDGIKADHPLSSQQVDDVVKNRTAKHRRRRRLLAVNSIVFNHVADDENTRLAARSEFQRCENTCSPREWKVLCAVGVGETYERIADAERVPTATIKTWVRRARVKLAA